MSTFKRCSDIIKKGQIQAQQFIFLEYIKKFNLKEKNKPQFEFDYFSKNFSNQGVVFELLSPALKPLF